jgi:hypothetical protein
VDQADLMRMAVEVLERLDIPYLVVGSAASSIYGEPRMTQDIDIVIDPTSAQLDQLCAAFPPDDYYVSVDAAHDALRTRTQFNVIHPESAHKIDFIIAGQDEWGRSQITRGNRVALLPGLRGVAGAPEDVILSKMMYYREGGSEKHLRDITGMLRISSGKIDLADIQKWAEKLGLDEVWQAVVSRLS